MKLKSLLLAILSVGMLASCTKEATENNPQDSNGNAYVSIKLRLPSGTSTTKAAGDLNEVFDDGKTDEYKVTDLTLLFFGAAAGVSDLSQFTITEIGRASCRERV